MEKLEKGPKEILTPDIQKVRLARWKGELISSGSLHMKWGLQYLCPFTPFYDRQKK